MKIEHVAVWTADLERLKAFYETYFGAVAGEKYANPEKGFESYFLGFSSGARLELMRVPGSTGPGAEERRAGLAHLAFCAGLETAVNELTEKLRKAGYTVVSEPRRTGDGYYESCVLDPDGNRVEITA